ncbi:MAG: hypothetical protein IJJ82_05625 [Clostridia bacterium]|nr:hypothetical protein [Clostridia bacterium]
MSNLPVKINRDSIFYKIKLFISNLFFKNKNQKNELNSEIIIEKKKQQDNTEVFIEQLQSDIKKQQKRERIITYIENDEKSIYKLSNERLKELIKMYDEEINNVDMKIRQLKYN